MKIVILSERNGDLYFLAKDDEELGNLLVSIVRGRHSEGWYAALNKLPKPPDPDLTPEQAAVLDPKSATAFLYKRQMQELDDWKFEERGREEFRAVLERALAGDAKSAKAILLARDDYEYEGVEIATPLEGLYDTSY